MLDQKHIKKTISQLTKTFEKTPEVQKSCTWMKQNPDKFTQIANEYLELMRVIDDFSEIDLSIIERVAVMMKEKKIERNSASHITTHNFVGAINKDVSLYQMACEAFNGSSEYFLDAVSQLGKMMHNGHKMFASGGTPKDGNSDSDSVIWGHTQVKKDADPVVLVHFITSHFLARFFSYALAEFNILKEKDDFFAPMTSALFLNEAKKPGQLSIIKVWRPTRDIGGLGWVREEKLRAYKEDLTT